MNPRKIVELGYDKIYKRYHEQRDFRSNKKEILDFVEHLPDNSKVLDVGCGSGYAAKFLVRKKFSVVGIDISKRMLKLAQKQVPKAKFYRMDMRNLKFQPKSFDTIICLYSIIHVPRKFHSKILGKFYRILKPNGILLISVGMTDTDYGIEENWLGTRMYWSHFDKKTNVKMIREAGFKIIWARLSGKKNDMHLFVLARKLPKV